MRVVGFRGEDEGREPPVTYVRDCLTWTAQRTHRYEKTTSMRRTNLLRKVGRNGEMKAGRKKTTDRTAWSC